MAVSREDDLLAPSSRRLPCPVRTFPMIRSLPCMVYTVVDDWYQESGWRLVRSRPGVKPRFSDSEVLTLEVVRELEGETRERRW